MEKLNKDLLHEQLSLQTLERLRLRHAASPLPLSPPEITLIQELLSQYRFSLQVTRLPTEMSSTQTLSNHLHSFQTYFPTFILSLANLKSNSPQWHLKKEEDLILQLLSDYYNAAHSQSSQQRDHDRFFNTEKLSELIVGLCRLKIPPHSLLTNTGFVENLQSALTPPGPFVGDLFWYFGTFALTWRQLSYALRQSILTGYLNSLSKLSAPSLATSIWAMAKMGMSWKQLPPSLQIKLLRRMARVHNELTCPQASKVIWGLSMLGIPSKSVPITLIENLVMKILYPPEEAVMSNEDLLQNTIDLELSQEAKRSVVHEKSKIWFADSLLQQHALTIGQTLIALAKLKIRWEQFTTNYQRIEERYDLCMKIIERFMNVVCPSYHPLAIANSVWALGMMGVSFGLITDSTTTNDNLSSQDHDSLDLSLLKQKLLQTVQRIIPECTAWTLTTIISGLSLMKFSWYELPETLQGSILTTVLQLQASMNIIDINRILYALATDLECRVESLPNYFRITILFPMLQRLSVMTGAEISNVLSSISALGVTWNELPSDIQWMMNNMIRKEVKNMSAHALGKCVYAMTLMGFDALEIHEASYRGIHETLLDGIIEKLQGIKSLSHQTLPLSLPLLQGNTASSVRERDSITIEDITNYRIFCHYLYIYQRVTNIYRIPKSLLNYQQSRMKYLQTTQDQTAVASVEQDTDRELLTEVTTSLPSSVELKRIFGIITPMKYTEEEKQRQVVTQYYQQLSKTSMTSPASAPMPLSSSLLIPSQILPTTASLLQEEIYRELVQAATSITMSSSFQNEEGEGSLSSDFYSALFRYKQLSVLKEVSYLDGLFPLDLMIILEDKSDSYLNATSSGNRSPPTPTLLAVVEVNGPSHYTRTLQQLQRKDVLKESLYRRLFNVLDNQSLRYYGPILYQRMKYTEIQMVGARVLCNQLLHQISENLQQHYILDDDQWGEEEGLKRRKLQLSRQVTDQLRRVQLQWKKVEQQCQSFFNWGLRNSKDDY